RARVRRAGPRLVLLVRLLPGLDLRQPLQGFLEPLLALAGGALPGGGRAARGGGGVVVHLLFPARRLILGLGEVLLEGLPAAEGGGAGAGADAHAVDGDAVEIDQILLAQDGDGVGQEPVEEVEVADPEVGEGVVVDGDAAGQPSEGVVVGAQPGQGTSAADGLEGGVQPQRDADLGVDGGVSGPADARADGVVQGRQVEATAEVPDEARLVVSIEEVLQGHAGDDLASVSRAQPRGRALAHGNNLTLAASLSPSQDMNSPFPSQALSPWAPRNRPSRRRSSCRP